MPKLKNVETKNFQNYFYSLLSFCLNFKPYIPYLCPPYKAANLFLGFV
jgi:hypothetical protein